MAVCAPGSAGGGADRQIHQPRPQRESNHLFSEFSNSSRNPDLKNCAHSIGKACNDPLPSLDTEIKGPKRLFARSMEVIADEVEKLFNTFVEGRNFFLYRTSDEVLVGAAAIRAIIDVSQKTDAPKAEPLIDGFDGAPPHVADVVHPLISHLHGDGNPANFILADLHMYGGQFDQIPESRLVLWLYLRDRISVLDLSHFNFVTSKRIDTLKKFFPDLTTVYVAPKDVKIESKVALKIHSRFETGSDRA